MKVSADLLLRNAADLWQLNQKGQGIKLDAIEPMLKAVVKKKIIFAGPVSDPKMNSSLGFAGINDTTRQAQKAAGGYVINGRSGFGTMSACADYLLTTARYTNPEKGPQCLLCFLPTNTKGVQIQNNWDTMSIRSSCSNDVVWDNVFISEGSLVPSTWDALSTSLHPGGWLRVGLLYRSCQAVTMLWTGSAGPSADQPMMYYPGNNCWLRKWNRPTSHGRRCIKLSPPHDILIHGAG